MREGGGIHRGGREKERSKMEGGRERIKGRQKYIRGRESVRQKVREKEGQKDTLRARDKGKKRD